jgi:hypothetical protein
MRFLKSIIILLITTNFCIAADLDSLKYFGKSIEEIQTGIAYADKISETQGSIGTLSKEQVDKIIYHSKKALEYSNKVLDKDLNKLDRSLFYKTLADKYENLFRKGLRLHILGWEEGDPIKGLEANKLLNEWGKYYRKLRKKMGFKN